MSNCWNLAKKPALSASIFYILINKKKRLQSTQVILSYLNLIQIASAWVEIDFII